MSLRPVVILLAIAVLAVPAVSAQKTVLYEHFTAVW
jgi:hypothetical protein